MCVYGDNNNNEHHSVNDKDKKPSIDEYIEKRDTEVRDSVCVRVSETYSIENLWVQIHMHKN